MGVDEFSTFCDYNVFKRLFTAIHRISVLNAEQRLNHEIVVRALMKAGWQILDENHYLAVGDSASDRRRLFVDIKAQHISQSIVILIEVKGLDKSPVHELMELIGQYVVYRAALDFLNDDTPLYVAITEEGYNDIVLHALGRKSLEKIAIPFVVYDTINEEITRWIPQP